MFGHGSGSVPPGEFSGAGEPRFPWYGVVVLIVIAVASWLSRH